jgi:hypothetical protein
MRIGGKHKKGGESRRLSSALKSGKKDEMNAGDRRRPVDPFSPCILPTTTPKTKRGRPVGSTSSTAVKRGPASLLPDDVFVHLDALSDDIVTALLNWGADSNPGLLERTILGFLSEHPPEQQDVLRALIWLKLRRFGARGGADEPQRKGKGPKGGGGGGGAAPTVV